MRRGYLFNVEYREPIAELERLSREDQLEAAWPADAVALTNTMIQRGTVRLYQGMGLQQAWRVLSPRQLGGVVDTVRTRILNLALSLEDVLPEAGQLDAPTPMREQLQPIITNIFGGTANVAVASSHPEQSIVFPSAGDQPGLLQFLRELGIDDQDLSDLQSALDGDRTTEESKLGVAMGPRATAWLGRLMLRATAVAGTAGAGALGTMAAKALAAHFGLPGV